MHTFSPIGEFGRSRQANAAGRSGDDRDPVRGQCGMIGQNKSSDLEFGHATTMPSARPQVFAAGGGHA